MRWLYAFVVTSFLDAKIFSTLLSVLVTKSLGPFFDTCNFSISPKSLMIILDAFSHALIIKFKFGDIELFEVLPLFLFGGNLGG